jgi:hypothetical protein
MTLNSSSSVSILLPDPRDQTQPLKASFDSTSKTVHDVISLEGIFVLEKTNYIIIILKFKKITGMFDFDVINLQLDMKTFEGSVYLNPLLSSNLTINLNRGK